MRFIIIIVFIITSSQLYSQEKLGYVGVSMRDSITVNFFSKVVEHKIEKDSNFSLFFTFTSNYVSNDIFKYGLDTNSEKTLLVSGWSKEFISFYKNAFNNLFKGKISYIYLYEDYNGTRDSVIKIGADKSHENISIVDFIHSSEINIILLDMYYEGFPLNLLPKDEWEFNIIAPNYNCRKTAYHDGLSKIKLPKYKLDESKTISKTNYSLSHSNIKKINKLIASNRLFNTEKGVVDIRFFDIIEFYAESKFYKLFMCEKYQTRWIKKAVEKGHVIQLNCK